MRVLEILSWWQERSNESFCIQALWLLSISAACVSG
jgi:hypothetical protein